MDDASTAGQFNIINGQLVYNTGSGTTDALYMWVEDPTDKTQRALKTWFNSTASSYGNFSFSGDTVIWTDPDVSRPNTAAFYVCPGNSTAGENALFVNTGSYAYETPSGCYDVDVSRAVRYCTARSSISEEFLQANYGHRFIHTELQLQTFNNDVGCCVGQSNKDKAGE